MSSHRIDTSLFDRAVAFAVRAHAGTERRGQGFPYVIHCMEAASIVSTMTADPELLAAAVLHDVVEDTPCTVEDLRAEFGDRVAELVEAESEQPVPGMSPAASWKERKTAAMQRLAAAPRDVQVVAMGDKLSNLRAIARDYEAQGSKTWQKFHCTDPAAHAWRWRGLEEVFRSCLGDTAAFLEFTKLVNHVFRQTSTGFSFSRKEDGTLAVQGVVDTAAARQLLQAMEPGTPCTLDFARVPDITYGAVRVLLTARQAGSLFYIVSAPRDTAQRFETTGATAYISVCRLPRHVDMSMYEETGEGATATSYFRKEGDTMLKLYRDFIPLAAVQREKRIAKAALLMGIPTPMTGDIVTDGHRTGLAFERIRGKRSFARIMSQEPERVPELSVTFARMLKKLHATPCDKAVFPSAAQFYREAVEACAFLSAGERGQVLDFLRSVPETGTCLHGDAHIGNVITNGEETLFIDMMDFSWGNPMFDVAMVRFSGMKENRHLYEHQFHVQYPVMEQFWNVFVREYFGISTDEEAAAAAARVDKFAAVRAIYLDELVRGIPWVEGFVRRTFFPPQS